MHLRSLALRPFKGLQLSPILLLAVPCCVAFLEVWDLRTRATTPMLDVDFNPHPFSFRALERLVCINEGWKLGRLLSNLEADAVT